MTKEQYTAMYALADREDIIIKKADKGSNIVIQNRRDYINEGLCQLSDTQFYQKIDCNLTHTHYT